MRVSPQLACLRRRLLRRALADAHLEPAEVALAIGVSPAYLAKMLSGTRVVTDAVAWRLWVAYGWPFHTLETFSHKSAAAAPARYR
jgi:plasmid maintenance system antidote protein VapI